MNNNPPKLCIKITGSHAAVRKIKVILGRDPDIHSGMAGIGKCCATVTKPEFDLLKEKGYKVTMDSRFRQRNTIALASKTEDEFYAAWNAARGS